MRRAVIRSGLLGAPVLASAALALSLPTVAVAAHPPRVTTGKVTRVRGTSVLLTGDVNPQGSSTTYFFQFGPTPAYGSHTVTSEAGSGTRSVKVGLPASPFPLGYHYRLVATNAAGTSLGKDRQFTSASRKLKIEVPKSVTVPWGTPVVVSGRLTGAGGANHRLALLASTYPYKEAFERIGLPTVSDATGRFIFRVGVLPQSTQFRVMTLDALPHFSKILHEFISVRVTLKARTSGNAGLARLYGTVTPVELRARVEFELQKAVRPGLTERTEERTTKFFVQGATITKRATRRFSRFSGVLIIRRTGRYRAFVVIRGGGLVSGASRTILIHAPPGHHVVAKRR
jgi:hypothetical protein